jgi:hypothetical protein
MTTLADDMAFCRARLAFWNARKITPELTNARQTLRDLRKDGIAIVPDFARTDLIAQITDEVTGNTDLMTTAAGPDIVHRNARLLLLNPEKHVPATTALFDDPRIRSLAQAYLSPNAAPDRPAIQLKRDIGETSAIDFYHIDEWKPLLSTFIYLSHVGPDNAPMHYLRGSHRWRPWRFRREQDFFAYYRRGSDGAYLNEESRYAGCMLPTDVRRLRERYGWTNISCEGDPGTLVIFDNLGLHRSTPLTTGLRLLLSSYWQLPQA